jgi:hypothetical protein
MKSWENSAFCVSRSLLRELTQETDDKQSATCSIVILCIYTQNSARLIFYEDAYERVVLACSMLWKMENHVSYVPFAFIMLITVVKCCFPSLSFPVNRLSSSSSVSL